VLFKTRIHPLLRQKKSYILSLQFASKFFRAESRRVPLAVSRQCRIKKIGRHKKVGLPKHGDCRGQINKSCFRHLFQNPDCANNRQPKPPSGGTTIQSIKTAEVFVSNANCRAAASPLCRPAMGWKCITDLILNQAGGFFIQSFTFVGVELCSNSSPTTGGIKMRSNNLGSISTQSTRIR